MKRIENFLTKEKFKQVTNILSKIAAKYYNPTELCRFTIYTAIADILVSFKWFQVYDKKQFTKDIQYSICWNHRGFT